MNERPVALITLASGYVGPPLARLLAAAGHDLVLHLPNDDRAMVGRDVDDVALVDSLRESGAQVEVITAVDLRSAEGNQAVVDAAINRFGRVDAACFVTGSIITGKFL